MQKKWLPLKSALMPAKTDSKQFIIGTRGSLLAKTQCTLFKNLLIEKTGHEFELKFITTQGDQQTDKPLWQMEGQNFFTKELDRALLNNEVDFVVHSYKDLGSVRPEGTEIACISKRSFAYDILLMPKTTQAQLKNKKELIIGTSSPRRIVNIERDLKNFLPHSAETKIKCKTLRGNVNSRIQKLKDVQYDGIVLAMAGLERLASFAESRVVLKELLSDLNFMILPQKEFPSAASQGALAVEVNINSPRYEEIKAVLQSAHDPLSAACIQEERRIFNEYGGGCHLSVGIHCHLHKEFKLIYEKGIFEEKPIEKAYILDEKPRDFGKVQLFIGEKQNLVQQQELKAIAPTDKNIFVTSKYCYHALLEQPQLLFSSGSKTHKDLAKKGFWINANADGLGHELIQELQSSQLLNLFQEDLSIITLSHKTATSPLGEVLACYERVNNENFELDNFDFDSCFWGSFSHYESYIEKYPQLKEKQHLCGLGKTFDQFSQNNINVIPIASMKNIFS